MLKYLPSVIPIHPLQTIYRVATRTKQINLPEFHIS